MPTCCNREPQAHRIEDVFLETTVDLASIPCPALPVEIVVGGGQRTAKTVLHPPAQTKPCADASLGSGYKTSNVSGPRTCFLSEVLILGRAHEALVTDNKRVCAISRKRDLSSTLQPFPSRKKGNMAPTSTSQIHHANSRTSETPAGPAFPSTSSFKP